MDPRWKELAEILVNHSVSVGKDERVMIAMTEIETYPLAQAVYEQVVKAGGYPQIQLLSETLRRSLLSEGSSDQISRVPDMEIWGMQWADVYIGLRGAHNLHELDDIPADRLSANQRAMGKVSSARWHDTRWVLVRVPNEAFAQEAGCSYEQIEKMFFDSCFLDWEENGSIWADWAKRLNQGSEIRILSDDTDLSFSVRGRTWVPFAGKNNMPDGEIATAPVVDTINGSIRFKQPGVLSGRLIEGICLTWEDGILVEASSQSEQDFFEQIISKDPGASKIGEFAFGTNRGVDRFCKDILIDEKIYGTIHIALGRAYPECGGSNESSIHWDIVKDLRTGGEVLLDGIPILRDGEILL